MKTHNQTIGWTSTANYYIWSREKEEKKTFKPKFNKWHNYTVIKSIWFGFFYIANCYLFFCFIIIISLVCITTGSHVALLCAQSNAKKTDVSLYVMKLSINHFLIKQAAKLDTFGYTHHYNSLNGKSNIKM